MVELGTSEVTQTYKHPVTGERVEVTLSLRDAIYFNLLGGHR